MTAEDKLQAVRLDAVQQVRLLMDVDDTSEFSAHEPFVCWENRHEMQTGKALAFILFGAWGTECRARLLAVSWRSMSICSSAAHSEQVGLKTSANANPPMTGLLAEVMRV